MDNIINFNKCDTTYKISIFRYKIYKKVGKNKMIVQGTMTIILNKDNNVLIAKRHTKKKIAPNRWNFIGGHTETGETVEESAYREIFEEVNLKVSNLIKIDEFPADWNEYKFNCNVFFCYVNDISNIKINREHTEFKFVKISDLWKYNIVGFPIDKIQYLLKKIL